MNSQQTFNYTYLEGDTVFFYENSLGKEENVMTYTIDSSNEKKIIDNANSLQALAAADVIPDGIGGRAVIAKNGSIMTTTVHLPATTTAPSSNGYIYSGFSGSGRNPSNTANRTVEADMGVVYSDAYNRKRWLPVINYYWGHPSDTPDNGHAGGVVVEPYSQGNYKNGYKPDQDISMTIYKNLNNNTRLSVRGYTWCADFNCNSQVATYTTHVIEVKDTRVSATTRWKFLATISDSFAMQGTPPVPVKVADAKGQLSGSLKAITLDGVAIPTPVKDGEDYATVTMSANNVFIVINKP